MSNDIDNNEDKILTGYLPCFCHHDTTLTYVNRCRAYMHYYQYYICFLIWSWWDGFQFLVFTYEHNHVAILVWKLHDIIRNKADTLCQTFHFY